MKRSLIVLLRPVVLICGDLFILFVLNLNHSCMRVCVSGQKGHPVIKSNETQLVAPQIIKLITTTTTSTTRPDIHKFRLARFYYDFPYTIPRASAIIAISTTTAINKQHFFFLILF